MDDITDVKEGNTDYIRWQIAEQIKGALSQDPQLAKQIFSWLRTRGLKITDY